MTEQEKKPDLRHGLHGTVKSDTEAHVVGAPEKPVEGDAAVVRPGPDKHTPAGQGTKQ